MIRDEQEEECVGTCPLTLSRGSSNQSDLSLIRVCSFNSTTEQDIIKSIHQRFLKLDTIFESIDKICLELQELVNLDRDLVILLLHKYNWKIDLLKDRYYNFDTQQFHSLQNRKLQWISHRMGQYKECPLCKQVTHLISNMCGHQSCYRCWDGYLSFGVKNQRRCFFKCFYEGCDYPILHSTILEMTKNKSEYFKNLTIDYIQNTKSLSFCPGVNCQYCYQDTSCLSKTVICIGCGTGFCFKCAGQPHQPCNCKQVQDWVELTKKQKCSESWISQNTKKCPHCRLQVEKTIGCDFINCACKNKFCYKCERNWDQKHSSHFRCPYQTEVFQRSQVQNPVPIQIQMLNKCFNQFLLNQSRVKSLKNWRFQTLKIKIMQYVPLTESQLYFITRGKDAVVKAAILMKWGEIFEYFNQVYRFKNQKHIKNLNADIIICMNLFTELDTKVTKLFATNQYLHAPGSKVKDFYKEKSQIETAIIGLEEEIKVYLKQINRQ